MDLKVNIGNLEGKSNWATWKYKILILLRTVPGAEDVVNGQLQEPVTVEVTATEEEVKKNKKEIEYFKNADTKALLILTTNMTEEVLTKVMRFHTSRDVWLELHRLYEGLTEDKTFNLCMEFFRYNFNKQDDMTNHITKLKNIWNNLNVQMSEGTKVQPLPEILLVCKILETLPSEYFSFKSSWLLMSKNERTIDNLTCQLCAHERALNRNNVDSSSENQEALTSLSNKNNWNKDKNVRGRTKIICYYCKKEGHIVRNCLKWKKDGKPPKVKTSENVINNMVLFATNNEVFSAECDRVNWFVDNGATNHVCNNRDMFTFFNPFDSVSPHKVTTANGDSVPAVGSGNIDIHTSINGECKSITLSNVWLVPGMSKNLFSVLSAQDKNPGSRFISTAEKCFFEMNGEKILTGERMRHGGLYKLSFRNNIDKSVSTVVGDGNILQLYHERLGHQNKRHVKTVIERGFGIKVKLDTEMCEGCVYGKAHRLKFGTRTRATVPGEVIHADVCGPLRNQFRATAIMYSLKMILPDIDVFIS